MVETRRRAVRLAGAILILALAVPGVAAGHHKPGHAGGPPHSTTTTTTTQPPSSTTSTVTTSTTAPPTTTTQPPSTTTTAPPGTIPPTLDVDCILPTSAHAGSCYRFELSEVDNKETPANECAGGASTACEHFWNAPYVGDRDGPGGDPHVLLPYPAGALWTPGERVAYGCGYALLRLGSPTGPLIGSATFAQIPGAGYVQVNDRGMVEGLYYWNGDPDTLGVSQVYRPGWCKAITAEAYEAYTGPDTDPLVAFFADGVHAESRDYRGTERLTTAGKFRLVDFITEPFIRSDFGDQVTNGNTMAADGVSRPVLVNQRATVVFYFADNSAAVVWYDAFGAGSLQVIADAG